MLYTFFSVFIMVFYNHPTSIPMPTIMPSIDDEFADVQDWLNEDSFWQPTPMRVQQPVCLLDPLSKIQINRA